MSSSLDENIVIIQLMVITDDRNIVEVHIDFNKYKWNVITISIVIIIFNSSNSKNR